MTRSRQPLDIRVVSASVRGTEVYRHEENGEPEWKNPDLIARCHAALLRPISTPLVPTEEPSSARAS
ncbi:hypothetical protein DEIPH_ctg013orf0006 [Deinococcus phoenicis]|uniref:Uncharacterized protein n=1 Tax=Deinococcus phoenicis TaxID=1476583 RepID=A0A016QSY0_9DEIO|nr:hypothetical protein [Deinococcus phoenicis]EYB68904.1 hypothetical protein DEIPH_ctg013orf0006 [Deinococcus phoenicis]